METSAQEVHENLNSIVDYQTHHRLRETQVGLYYINFKVLFHTLALIRKILEWTLQYYMNIYSRVERGQKISTNASWYGLLS